MTAPDNKLALQKVSSEIDESECKITFANQCIKAQEDLCKKLMEDVKRQKEQFNSLKLENSKLEVEIKDKQNEIECSLASTEAIKRSNVELRKELLLKKEYCNELVQRVKDGEKKYDTMWLEAKQRFESMPLVQQWMKATQETETLTRKLDALDQEIRMLNTKEREKKRQILAEERKLIIELAEFMTEYNADIKKLKDEQEEFTKLSKEVEMLRAKQSTRRAPVPQMSKLSTKPSGESGSQIVDDESWLNLRRNIYNDSLMMPKRRSSTTAKEVLDVKLDLKKAPMQVTPIKKTISMSASNRVTSDALNERYMACYFSKLDMPDEDTGSTSEYSKKKLISILDVTELDENETNDIVSKIKPAHLKEVSVISTKPIDKKNGKGSPKDDKGPIVSEEIEEIDLTTRSSQTLLMPPSQFADIIMYEDNVETRAAEDESAPNHVNMSLEHTAKGGRKNAPKKKVSFDTPVSVSVHEISDDDDECQPDETLETVTGTPQEDGTDNNDSFMNLREMLLKKHTLDLSPQFVYGKKKTDENVAVVRSKFFETNVEAKEKNKDEKSNNKTIELEEAAVKEAANEKQSTAPTADGVNEDYVNIDGDKMKSPYEKRPEVGMLFTHGPEGIPDCMDVSMSITGYEEGDTDFRQYLDSSLMMSPKADSCMSPMSLSGNPPEVQSQEVPNFLSAFKKSGFSFFNQSPGTSSEANPENQENSFNFNFDGGSQEKKSKGLFSFFR